VRQMDARPLSDPGQTRDARQRPDRALLVVWLVVATLGCGRRSGDGAAAPDEPTGHAATPGANERAAAEDTSASRLCVEQLIVEATDCVNAGLDLPAAARLRAEVALALGRLEVIDSVSAQCAQQARHADRVGIWVKPRIALLDASGRPQRTQPELADGALALEVTVQVERATARGHPDIGLRTFAASVPFRGRPAATFATFAQTRLVRTTALAAADALGQVWVRRMSDDAIAALLESEATWQRIAALREVGERGGTQQLARVHAAAWDSRTDVAVVAIAALGRIGTSESVAALATAMTSA